MLVQTTSVLAIVPQNIYSSWVTGASATSSRRKKLCEPPQSMSAGKATVRHYKSMKFHMMSHWSFPISDSCSRVPVKGWLSFCNALIGQVPSSLSTITLHYILQAAKALHLRIPEDLAVIGFDDLEFAAHVNPPLTTVVQQFIDIGLRAGTLLISRIEGIVGAPKHIELPTSLVIRESCGAQLHVKRFLSLSQETIKQPSGSIQEKGLSYS